jgi:hypothetical protein
LSIFDRRGWSFRFARARQSWSNGPQALIPSTSSGVYATTDRYIDPRISRKTLACDVMADYMKKAR